MLAAGGQVQQDKYAGDERRPETDILSQDVYHFLCAVRPLVERRQTRHKLLFQLAYVK